MTEDEPTTEPGPLYHWVRDRRGPTLDWALFGLCPECWMPTGLPCRDLRYATGSHYTAEPHAARPPTSEEAR